MNMVLDPLPQDKAKKSRKRPDTTFRKVQPEFFKEPSPSAHHAYHFLMCNPMFHWVTIREPRLEQFNEPLVLLVVLLF